MIVRRLAPVVAALTVAACSPARIDLRYDPAGSAEPLHVKRLPRLLVGDVEDRTGGAPIYSGVGATQTGVLVRPLPEVVKEAVRIELSRDGIPVVFSRTGADAALRAAVTAAHASIEAGAGIPVSAALSVSVQLRSLDGDVLWSHEAAGRASSGPVTAPGFPGDKPQAALNAALAAAMKDLSNAFMEEGPFDRVFHPRVAAPSASPVPTVSAADIPSDLDELPPAATVRPHAYAIVVGLEHYREKLPNADFAAGDAKLASQYFQRVLGIPEENIVLLTDDRATKGDFEKYFERWLPNRVEAGDTVYVYYSGHGAPNPSKGDSYLVPFDGDPAYIDQTGFAVKRMLDDLAKLPAKQVFVAMDSCFSGAGGRSVIAKGARPLVSVVQSEVPAKVTVLSASAGDQISNSYQEKGHGLFTYFLLKGLKEKGGDLRAAFAFAKPEVARMARREYNADQEPQWREGR